MYSLAVACLCSTALFAAPTGGEAFPYKAYVTAADVYVRSGPGRSYYPTDKLKRGEAVEVYRHDPGGWCAVRPVEGSFTWVSGRFLRPIEDDLAVVTAEGVSARVGSRFSDVRDVIQVRLNEGEVVAIVEQPGEGEIWYKIAPPAGEFRWVSAKYLDPDYPHEGVRRAPDRLGVEHSNSAWPWNETNSPRADEESLRSKSARPRSLSADQFDAELERIELELAVMVVEEPTVWSFGDLRRRTNLLLDRARTAIERGRARLLADRIARFEDIKRRQEAVLAMRERVDSKRRIWDGLRPGVTERALAGTDGRFDGVGRLRRVVSSRLDAPRYALMDESEEVLCYVTPAPGVNLHDYIGRRVGVNGTRGYMPEKRAAHVMARHVAPLEGRMLR